jgi:2-phospho-L-lactate/phosphoenolpyruvate guanylyltransferase
MTRIALVPVKGWQAGKQRLARSLDPRDRGRLIELMLVDVLAALRASGGVAQIRIVSPDSRMVPNGCVWADDGGTDLNSALWREAHAAVKAGATSIVVMAADVPLADPEDIRSLLAASCAHDVVIVPDRHGTGTNAMTLAPPTILRPQFGPLSCALHQSAAAARHCSIRTLELASLAHDIDQPEDLLWLMESNPDRYDFLRMAALRAS